MATIIFSQGQHSRQLSHRARGLRQPAEMPTYMQMAWGLCIVRSWPLGGLPKTYERVSRRPGRVDAKATMVEIDLRGPPHRDPAGYPKALPLHHGPCIGSMTQERFAEKQAQR